MPNPNSDMIQFVSRRSFNVIQYGAAKKFYKEPFVNFGLLVFDLGGIGCFFCVLLCLVLCVIGSFTMNESSFSWNSIDTGWELLWQFNHATSQIYREKTINLRKGYFHRNVQQNAVKSRSNRNTYKQPQTPSLINVWISDCVSHTYITYIWKLNIILWSQATMVSNEDVQFFWGPWFNHIFARKLYTSQFMCVHGKMQNKTQENWSLSILCWHPFCRNLRVESFADMGGLVLPIRSLNSTPSPAEPSWINPQFKPR